MTIDEPSATRQGDTINNAESLPVLALRTRSTFVIPPDEGQLFLSLMELLARISAPFHEIGNALRANIAGVISTVTVPYTLANRSATDSAWQRISTAERIRALEVRYGTETEAELKARDVREDQVARESAKSKMERAFSGHLKARRLSFGTRSAFLRAFSQITQPSGRRTILCSKELFFAGARSRSSRVTAS